MYTLSRSWALDLSGATQRTPSSRGQVWQGADGGAAWGRLEAGDPIENAESQAPDHAARPKPLAASDEPSRTDRW